MSYTYIASPYTHDEPSVMDERYIQVAKFCAHAARNGYIVYSPIAHWHPIAVRFDLPRDHKYWQKQNEITIVYSRGIWVLQLPGWEDSAGVASEIKFAQTLGRPVSYINPRTYERHLQGSPTL